MLCKYWCKIIYQIDFSTTLHSFFSKQIIALKCRVYLIKIKSLLKNFGSEKQFKVENAYLMTTEIDFIGEK